jgi:hypothetical protein
VDVIGSIPIGGLVVYERSCYDLAGDQQLVIA